MKLSIIIPVYRTEGTLDRCLKSVVTQSFRDIEVILVDDGSPDNCPQLCDEWARRDARIRVVHKTNGGLSDARNAGIDLATGDYLTFVDSDDYLGTETLLPLMQHLEAHPDYDLLEYPIEEFYGSHKHRSLRFPHETVYTDMQDYWIRGEAYAHSYACNKVYRRRLFERQRFPKGRLFEDAYTLPQLLKLCKTVATTDRGRYYYCANEDGITATADGEAYAMLLEAHTAIVNQLHCDTPETARYYLHVLNIQMDVFELTGAHPTLEEKQLDSRFFDGKEKLKVITLNMLGIKRTCKLNKLLHKLWKSHS